MCEIVGLCSCMKETEKVVMWEFCLRIGSLEDRRRKTALRCGTEAVDQRSSVC